MVDRDCAIRLCGLRGLCEWSALGRGRVKRRETGRKRHGLCRRLFLKAAESRVARGRAAGLIVIYLSVALEERCAALLHDVFRQKAERSSPHCLHQRHDPEDLHRAFQVVGQDMQTHFGADLGQSLHEKVRRPHPRFKRTERMLDGLPPDARSLRHLVQSSLHRLQDVLVLPARDAPVFSSRTLRFDRAFRTCGGPVFVDDHTVLDRAKAPDCALTRRTLVLVIGGDVAEVLFVELSFGQVV